MVLLQKFVGWQGLNKSLGGVQTTLDGVAAPVLNIASAALGLLLVWQLVVTVRKHQRGEPGSSDSLMSFGITVIGVVLVLQVIRILFFN